MFYRTICVTLFSILLCSASHAQEPQWRLEHLSQLDRNVLDSQIERLDSIIRLKLGRQLSGQKHNDLALLQRLLDQQLIRADQTAELQAMGMVLGELLKAQEGLLWVVYIDQLGRSKALQIPGINEFIFPISQISQRVSVGIAVDVQQIYRSLEQAVADIRHQPRYFR